MQLWTAMINKMSGRPGAIPANSAWRDRSEPVNFARSEWAIFLAWCAIVAAMSLVHEMWRDEVRALTLAIDARSLWSLPRLLQGEGHPILWYAALWAAYRVTSSVLVLPALSLLFSGLAVMLVVFKSPLPRWCKALFVFGLPLYEYSIMARNYGVSMLLLFVFSWWYGARRTRPIRLGIVLALLCNTNIHSILLAAPLIGLWTWDMWRERKQLSRAEIIRFGLAMAIIVASVALAVATVWPTGESVASDASQYTASRVLVAAANTLNHPAAGFQDVMPSPPGPFSFLGSAVLLGAILGLARRPAAIVAALAGWLGFGVLFQIVYSGGLRHEGLFVVFLLTLHWLTLETDAQKRHPFLEAVGFRGCLPIILAVLVGTSCYGIFQDAAHQVSASRAFGRFLKSHPEYATSTLVGEPDFALESLLYYADNPLYIVREHRFGRRVHFVRSARQQLSLGQLLRSAQEVQTRERKSVLIVLGHLDELDPRKSPALAGSISYSFGRTFSWSAEDLRIWNESTILVQRFADNVIDDERYVVYGLAAFSQ
jgi:hypothetical protein